MGKGNLRGRRSRLIAGGWISTNYFGDASDGDVSTSGNVTHTVLSKDGSYDGDMLVLNYNSLIINTGHTMTVDQPCKGMLVYVKGNCTIDGILTMTARGALENPAAVSATGLRLPVFKAGETETLAAADYAGCGAAAIAAVANQTGISGDGKIYTIAKVGAAGGAQDTAGANNGAAGTTGQSGGGGSGNQYGTAGHSGAGVAGTCFSGGGGGGGGVSDGVPTDATTNGGAGGTGGVSPVVDRAAGGGAGNPGGVGHGSGTPVKGDDGTGGLLVLIVAGDLTIGASGIISANGKNGGGATGTTYHTGGGASGGGNVLILYAGALSNAGAVQANGGVGGVAANGNGGTGGAGSVQGPTVIDL